MVYGLWILIAASALRHSFPHCGTRRPAFVDCGRQCPRRSDQDRGSKGFRVKEQAGRAQAARSDVPQRTVLQCLPVIRHRHRLGGVASIESRDEHRTWLVHSTGVAHAAMCFTQLSAACRAACCRGRRTCSVRRPAGGQRLTRSARGGENRWPCNCCPKYCAEAGMAIRNDIRYTRLPPTEEPH
jgi:hypothetical protein